MCLFLKHWKCICHMMMWWRVSCNAKTVAFRICMTSLIASFSKATIISEVIATCWESSCTATNWKFATRLEVLKESTNYLFVSYFLLGNISVRHWANCEVIPCKKQLWAYTAETDRGFVHSWNNWHIGCFKRFEKTVFWQRCLRYCWQSRKSWIRWIP